MVLKKLSPISVLRLFFFIVLLISIIPTALTSIKNNKFTLQNKAKEPDDKMDKTIKNPLPEYAPGEVIVKFKSSVPALEVKSDRKTTGVNLEKQEVDVADLNVTTSHFILRTLIERKKILKIEKIFRGAEEPAKELIKFKQKFAKEITDGKRRINEQEFLKIDLSKTYKIKIDKTVSVEDMVQELSSSPEVEYAEPNYIYKTQLIPNDLEFSKLWGLHNMGQTGGKDDADIDAPEAWNITTGDDKVIVGVIDTGIDYNHEDLKDCQVPHFSRPLSETFCLN